MAPERPDRRLPDRYFLKFIEAVREETGDYGLKMILKNAGLEKWNPEETSASSQERALASDLAGMQFALRTYYGGGARGILIRVGRVVWKKMVEDTKASQKTALQVHKNLPFQARRARVLEYLAGRMGGESGQSFVYPMDPSLIFVDHFSDPTLGQKAEEPICWSTVGMIYAALEWITGIEHVVEEISCIATGDKACRFEIWQ